MNSGCYGDDISKILNSIKVVDIHNCLERELLRGEIVGFFTEEQIYQKILLLHL